MVKSREETIKEFNEEVNMTVEELEKWLEDPKSTKAGTGVGIESGHKIIEILRKNPDKDPEKYDEASVSSDQLYWNRGIDLVWCGQDDIVHMRKVVSYAKRHLAQEDHLKHTKTREELENTKSTISLKNWGHDPVKTLGQETIQKRDEEASEATESAIAPSGNDKARTQDVEGNPTQEDTTEDDDETETRKRKLNEEEPKREQGETVTEAGDSPDAAGDVEDNKETGEAEDQNLEDRPRKKSKVSSEEKDAIS
ncbi:hypothetical protein BC628DRAFT_909465 [Trametes gibbosa]|nr:hypothetical protein BC628DRAFT_909465 [Trametes gibbosa]